MGKSLIIKGADFSNVAANAKTTTLTKNLCRYEGFLYDFHTGTVQILTQIQSTDLISDYIPIERISHIQTNGQNGTTATYYLIPGIVYFDENKNVIGKQDGNIELPDIGSWYTLDYDVSELTIPTGTAYIRIQMNTQEDPFEEYVNNYYTTIMNY